MTDDIHYMPTCSYPDTAQAKTVIIVSIIIERQQNLSIISHIVT